MCPTIPSRDATVPPVSGRPFRNRVQSTGEIVAVRTHGTFMGNRGRIHGADRALGLHLWERLAWITCTLERDDRRPRREVMGPRGYTHLFFLDEAVALAAGHRPCAQCRREAYDRFRAAWPAGSGPKPLAGAMDARLHEDRIDPTRTSQRRHTAALDDLPDGVFVLAPGTGDPALVLGQHLVPCGVHGYGQRLARPRRTEATVLTPRCSVEVLAAGYRPALHSSASAG